MKIIQSKLTFPSCYPYLKRDRLVEFMEKIKKASIIAVTAENGYGKKTLISSYIQQKNIPAVWYKLDNSDRYDHVFLTYLKTGLQLINNEELNSPPTHHNNKDDELEKLITHLTNRTEPLWIVLDDYQTVDQSTEIQQVIENLIIHSASDVKFIFISRNRPKLSTKLKIRKTYKEISTSVLAFTWEETKAFFNHAYELNLEDYEIDLIYKVTEGWVACYQLIYGIINTRNKVERHSFWAEFPNVPDIFDYLSKEVLDVQDKETRQFLYKTSLLSELDPYVINDFLGINDSEKIINKFLENHLFIYRDEQGLTRYHNLFRQFLYRSYKNSVGLSSLSKDHLNLSNIYKKTDRFPEAFAHSTIGQDYPNAVKLMEWIQYRYNPIELMSFLDGWLEEISPGQSLANNTLFLIRCIPMSTLKELVPLFKQNIESLQKKNNQLWLSNLEHRLGYIYFLQGKLEDAKKLFLDSLDISEKFQDHSMTALNLLLIAEIEGYFSNHSEALEAVRQSLYISERFRIKHTQLHALDTVTTVYTNENKFDKADSYITQALNIAKQYDPSSLPIVYTTMGKLASKKGNIEEAIMLGKKAIEQCEKYNIDFDTGYAFMNLGISYMKNESWDEAEYWLDRAEKILSHFKFYYSQILCAQKELYEKIGNQTKKSDKNTELLKVCKENGYYWLINNKKSDNLKVIEPNEKRLFIYTLGHFQVYYDKKLISISRNSSLRLLQYLITNRMKKINKDLLLDELFPEGQLDSINNQLHVSLSILRKALEPGLSSGVQSKFIVRSGNHYIFNRDEVYLDIDEFWSLFNSSNERKTPDLQSLKRAEELYKGNFFEEYPYEMFLEAEREKLRSAHLKILRELADHFYEEDDYDRCFQYYENIISKYPYEESIYYEYIVLLLKQNLHLQANSVAKRMVYNMKQELGIDVRESLNVLLAKYNSLQVN